MFKTAKIETDQLIETIKSLRTDTSYLNQKKKLNDLIDLFEPLLSGVTDKMVKAFSGIANEEFRDALKSFIIASFTSFIMKKVDTTRSIGEVIKAIEIAMKWRINKHEVSKWMGLTENPLQKIEYWIKKYLRDFYRKFGRQPDFNNESDVIEYAKIYFKKDEINDQFLKKIKNIISMLGEQKMESLYKEIGETGDEGTLQLIDVLESDEPLPDKVFENTETKEILESEMNRLLEDDESKAFIMFEEQDVKKKDIAKTLKTDVKEVDKLLDNARKKLLTSPKLRKLRTSIFMKLVKAACSNFEIVESNGIHKFARKNTESMIKEIVKTAVIINSKIKWTIRGYGHEVSSRANYQFFHNEKDDKFYLYRYIGAGRKKLLGKFKDPKEARAMAEKDWSKNPEIDQRTGKETIA